MAHQSVIHNRFSIVAIPHLQDGWTALHLASQQGHVEVVRVLIAAKARINQCSKVQQPVNAKHFYHNCIIIMLVLGKKRDGYFNLAKVISVAAE